MIRRGCWTCQIHKEKAAVHRPLMIATRIAGMLVVLTHTQICWRKPRRYRSWGERPRPPAHCFHRNWSLVRGTMQTLSRGPRNVRRHGGRGTAVDAIVG